MSTDVKIKAEDAKRLKLDTAFLQFMNDVRDAQIQTFRSSTAEQIEQREDAHAILRALDLVEAQLDAAIVAETLQSRRKNR